MLRKIVNYLVPILLTLETWCCEKIWNDGIDNPYCTTGNANFLKHYLQIMFSHMNEIEVTAADEKFSFKFTVWNHCLSFIIVYLLFISFLLFSLSLMAFAAIWFNVSANWINWRCEKWDCLCCWWMINYLNRPIDIR